LQSRWETLFRAKGEQHVRAIQDGFNCCGLLATTHQPWPFPAKGITEHLCGEKFKRTKRCLEDWRAKEQTLGGMMLVVNILLMLWQLLLMFKILRNVNLLKSWIGGNFTEYRSQSQEVEFDDDDADRYTDAPTDAQPEEFDGRRVIQHEGGAIPSLMSF
jgi:hypothetical protein